MPLPEAEGHSGLSAARTLIPWEPSQLGCPRPSVGWASTLAGT